MKGYAIIQSLVVTFCVLLVIGFPFSSGQTTTSKNVICYYRVISDLSIRSIDVSICTHLVFDYAYIPYDDLIIIIRGHFKNKRLEQFKDLKVSNPSLKTLLAVSGFDNSSSKVSNTTYKNRQIFYTNAINFLRSWDFDGVNFLWDTYTSPEIVTKAQSEGVPGAAITQRFLKVLDHAETMYGWNKMIKYGWTATTLVMEIRVALTDEATSSGREPLIFMLRLPGWTGAMRPSEGVDFQPLGEAVDILEVTLLDNNLLVSYPQYTTGLENPLYGNGGNRGNVSGSITKYLDAGVAAEKLHMGVELSAPLFILSDRQLTGVGAPTSEIWGMTQFSYREVCERLLVDGYTTQLDPEGLVNFAYKRKQWITYEDPASLEIKMNYVNEHNLGGVAVEYLDDDDYSGEFCNQGKYPLTTTLYRLA